MLLKHRTARIAIGFAVVLSASGANAAPASSPRSQTWVGLASQRWDLVEWSGGQTPQGKRLRLDFDAERGSFAADTMCNGARGPYRIKGKSIRFGDGKGQFASTLMGCPEPAMSWERQYLRSLSAVRSWRLEGGRLILTTAKGETLIYSAAHKPAADAPRKFIYVSAEQKPCSGVARMMCLQVRDKESDPWQLHYGGIADFVPQPGIEYKLRITEEKIANPPADGSSILWTLDQVIEQRVVNP